MQQIDQILLVVSSEIVNDEAVERAAAFARAHGARVMALAAIDHVPSLRPGADLDVDKSVVEANRSKLEETVAALQNQGVSAESKVRVGVSFVEVILEAQALAADIVIQMAEGPESEGTNVAGSSLRLMRKCPCPVWVTRPRERMPYKRIVAAVDPTDDRPGRDPKLDAKILTWARDIALTDGAELVVLHASPAIDKASSIGNSAKQMSRRNADSEQEHRESLDQLLSSMDFSGLDPKPCLVHGHPTTVIPQTVAAQRADLLIMGTVARTGIRGFFMGNTAEKVIQRVECSMLTLKPNGFVSPVQRDE